MNFAVQIKLFAFCIAEPLLKIHLSDFEKKSLVKLVDSNHKDLEGDNSGFLLYNNKTLCADEFTNSMSATLCRLIGFSNSRNWIATENVGRYEMNLGSLKCISDEEEFCILRNLDDCSTGFIVYLFCTGKPLHACIEIVFR